MVYKKPIIKIGILIAIFMLVTTTTAQNISTFEQTPTSQVLTLDNAHHSQPTTPSPLAYTHTVLAEQGTATWCFWCQFVSQDLDTIFTEGSRDFYYVALVDDKLEEAADRLDQYNLAGFPTVFYDGGYEVVVGAASQSTQESAIDSCGARTPESNIDLDVTVNWKGNAVIDVSVDVTNNDPSAYNGYLRAFVVEKESRWLDYAGIPYKFAMIGYAFNQSISVPASGNTEYSATWDGKLHNEIGGGSFGDITKNNTAVIAAVYNPTWHQGYADPPDRNPFDAYYVDQTAYANATESSIFVLDGECFYDDAKTQPVNNLDVVIENLNTGQSWPAETTNNAYTLELTPGVDVNAGDTLRYFATDDGHYINVTDRTVTSTDISNGGITLDLILKEYYTDLTDFPYYPTEDHSSAGRTMEEMTGPACLEMATDYMHWNTTTDPGTTAPRYTQNNLGDQLWIYNEARSLQTNTDHTYVSARGMQQFLQNYMPLPYGNYGYNFNIKYTGCPWNENWTQNSLLGALAIWTDYSTSYALDYDSENKQTVADPYGEDDKPLKPGHKPHVPAFIPAFGDYGRWMAIRGLHTDTEPWIFEHPHAAAMDEINSNSQANALTIYGFWVNDPLTTGIGENTYKTGDELKNTYFVPLNQTNDPYDGEYVAVVEPPADYTKQDIPETHIGNWPTHYRLQPTTTSITPATYTIYENSKIIKAAFESIQKLTALNPELDTILKQSTPVAPLYVTAPNEYQNDYYLVTFNDQQNSWVPRNGNDHKHNTASLVVLLDAHTGQFKEISYVSEPVEYLTIDEKTAAAYIVDHLTTLGYTNIKPQGFTQHYIYRQNSPFYPDIQVETPYGTYIVTQTGEIIS